MEKTIVEQLALLLKLAEEGKIEALAFGVIGDPNALPGPVWCGLFPGGASRDEWQALGDAMSSIGHHLMHTIPRVMEAMRDTDGAWLQREFVAS